MRPRTRHGAAADDRIYLDNAATTRVDPAVAEVMQRVLLQEFGNPSSIHSYGRAARDLLDNARDAVGSAIGAQSGEILFTSGGTESDNLALVGVLMAVPAERRRLIVSAGEHHAVLDTASFLSRLGVRVEQIPVNQFGEVEAPSLEAALKQPAALVSIMHGNNEVGTVNDIATLAAASHRGGALFHTDAVQTAGTLALNVEELGCDLLSLSSHKFYGPNGAGALYVRAGVPIEPLLHGGSQERGLRGGTENAAAICGLARAIELASERQASDSGRVSALREYFSQAMVDAVPGSALNGRTARSLPGISNLRFDGIEATALLVALDRHGVAASAGSACASGAVEPSHVLLAMGLSRAAAESSVRFSMGRHTTREELDEAVEITAREVARIRSG